MDLKRILPASLLAAVAAFFWGFVSWTLLPWHHPVKFKDSAAVSQVLKANAPDHGIYQLPSGPESVSDEAGMKQYGEDIKTGPYVWAMVHPGVKDYSMGRSMALGLLRAFLAAVILSLLLSWMACDSFRRRVTICVLSYLLVSINSEGPLWIWFNFPLPNLLIMTADHLIEGLLVGLVLAKTLRPAAKV